MCVKYVLSSSIVQARPETGSCVPPLTHAVLVSSPVFVAVDLGPGASLEMVTSWEPPAASLVVGGNDHTVWPDS